MLNHKVNLKMLLYILVGNLGYTLAFNMFFTPHDIAAGGFGGLGMVVNHFFPAIPMGAFVFVISIPVFLWAWKVEGFRYLVSALVSTAVFSAMLDLSSFLPSVTDDRLLASVCGGALFGVSASVLVRGYVSGSGTDLLARLLVTKFRHVSLGTMVMICDGFVVALSAVAFHEIESAIYAAIALMIASFVTDASIRGVNRASIFQIIMDGDPAALGDAIMNRLDRGATLIKAVGMYKGGEKSMILVAVRPREVYELKSVIKETAPGAFVMLMPANEIMGLGFEGLDVTVPVKDIEIK